MSVSFKVDLRTTSPLNERVHWAVRKKRVATERAAVRWSSFIQLGVDWCSGVRFPVTVTFTRIGKKLLDDDNLAGAFKSMRDELADMLSITDGPEDGRASWRYAQRKGEKYGVEVCIETQQPWAA